MRKILNILTGFVAYLICAVILTGYGHTETHPYLNEMIALKFMGKSATGDFKDKMRFKNYSFNWNNSESPKLTGPAFIKGKELYITFTSADEESVSYTPMVWLQESGWMEDEPWAPASLCHFYDPLAIDGAKYITDRSGLVEFLGTPAEYYMTREAPGWAVSDPKHTYSWNNGKDWMIKALREPDPDLRKAYMAKAYRSLGQVLHLLCDMGCTPHVRNDSHPPNILIMGDPDPYEDLTKAMDVLTLSQINPPSSRLKEQFDSMEKIEDIFESLAVYTNNGFFSGQTIYTDKLSPMIRPDNPYPSPKVVEADYHAEDFIYYKKVEGVDVKLCKDKWALGNQLNLRNFPYLDNECVESMAAAIYPNIAQAGANAVRLFIPSLRMDITEIKADSGGIIRGKVWTIRKLDDEYSNLLDNNNIYNGPVSLFKNKTDTKIVAQAVKNKFEFRLEGQLTFSDKDWFIAQLEFGGIVISSDPVNSPNTIPEIMYLTPDRGDPGDEITIQGRNFGNDKTKGEVHFSGVVADPAGITRWTDNLITVKVPAQALTGKLKVKVNQVFSNEMNFQVGGPQITSISPGSGLVGDVVTITGKGFGSAGTVTFDSVRATEVSSWTGTSISVKVPFGATSGEVFVEVNGIKSNGYVFTVKAGEGASFSYSWERIDKTYSWPWPKLNCSISGSVTGTGGNNVLEIKAHSGGGASIYFSERGPFKIGFNCSFSVLTSKIDTTYANGTSTVITFIGPNKVFWSTLMLDPEVFRQEGNSGSLVSQRSYGAIEFKGLMKIKTEEFDENKKLLTSQEGALEAHLGFISLDIKQ